MTTDVCELQTCIQRMIEADMISAESEVWLLSRDGEQLRAIEEIIVRQPAGYIMRGEKERLAAMSYLIQGTVEEDRETKLVSDLMFFAEYAQHTAERCGYQTARVRLLADGFGMAHWADLEAIKLNTEIHSLTGLELTETSLVLCT